MRRPVLALFVISVCWRRPRWPSRPRATSLVEIIDQQGAIVPGATVTGTNPATGFTPDGGVGRGGVFKLTSLPVGNYDIRVELSGLPAADDEGDRRQRLGRRCRST